MAMVDYGAIAFKNGKCIQTDMFNDMFDTVGWADKELNGNYFTYVGDENFSVGFYKCQFYYKTSCGKNKHEYLNCTNYYGWKEYQETVYLSHVGVFINIKISKVRNNDYFKATIKYRDDVYIVYFGFGVDYDHYKKTGRYNLYSDWRYKIKSFFVR